MVFRWQGPHLAQRVQQARLCRAYGCRAHIVCRQQSLFAEKIALAQHMHFARALNLNVQLAVLDEEHVCSVLALRAHSRAGLDALLLLHA